MEVLKIYWEFRKYIIYLFIGLFIVNLLTQSSYELVWYDNIAVALISSFMLVGLMLLICPFIVKLVDKIYG
jgi:hypothetical protein